MEVGISMALGKTYPHNPHNPVNHIVVRCKDYLWNWWFLRRIRKHLDYIGVNFYSGEYLDWRGQLRNPDGPYSDLGWYMNPGALCDMLVDITRRYHLPVMVTENGLADSTDKYRTWWIKESIAAMQQAIEQGVELRGYLHWSLLDNFEWAFGWWPKFGLVAVDRKTMKRTVRKSTRWFAEELQRIRD
jgi:beta-glucosidase